MPKKPVAEFDMVGAVFVGISDVIRWGDTVKTQGVVIDIAKAVELGISHDLEIARKLEKDLKSKTGLLITFPIAFLLSHLQEKLGSAEKVTKAVKAV
jgi:hypothetical protein